MTFDKTSQPQSHWECCVYMVQYISNHQDTPHCATFSWKVVLDVSHKKIKGHAQLALKSKKWSLVHKKQEETINLKSLLADIYCILVDPLKSFNLYSELKTDCTFTCQETAQSITSNSFQLVERCNNFSKIGPYEKLSFNKIR